MDSKDSPSDPRQAGDVMLTKPIPPPTLNVPPRNAADALIKTSDATPSPMTFVSSFFADDSDCKSFSQLLAGAMASPSPKFTETLNDTTGFMTNTSQSMMNPLRLADKDASNRGSSDVGRSSTARFKTMTPARLPIPRSPYLTIPPGLSPTTLLDSPVLLSTGQAEPSPTTGTFPLPPFIHGTCSTSASASSASNDQSSEQDASPSFVFKPFPKLGRNPMPTFTNLGPFGLSHQQALAQVQAEAHAQVPASSSSPAITVANSTMGTGSSVSSLDAAKLVLPLQSRGPLESTSQTFFEPSEKTEHLQSLAHPPPLIERPSEDGYNWRKYGQKQVKGSEFPRSYYKCTHPNCSVKKKVERSHDGQVTEIVYKGEHNHLKPQATRRMSVGASRASDGSGREGSFSLSAPRKVEGSAHPHDFKSERMCMVSDPSSSSKNTMLSAVNGTPEASLGSISDDEGEDGGKGEEGDDDEPDSKRRKEEKAKETLGIAPLRTIREPRVVVQTTSDVDILDDGYRWRKYGQKVVKGNPHPRSYYKCTNLGCLVRKHVERSSTDSKAVITTYEGKHNHDVPAARNSNSNVNSHSNHDNSKASVTTKASSSAANIGLTNCTIAKPAASLQDQFLLGKLLEDRLKAAGNSVMGLDSHTREFVSGPLATEQCSRVQAVPEHVSQVSMNLMDSGIVGRPPDVSNPFMQNLILKPKEEQGDVQSFDRSLQQPAFSSASSFCQEMQQRIVLGP